MAQRRQLSGVVPPSTRIVLLLRALEQGFNKKSWHGTNLRGSLRGITPEQALWRPGPDRHNIWELAVHAAYWKYTVVRRIRGGARGGFPLEGSNWFPRSADPDAKAWREDLRILEEQHRGLLDAVAGLADADLDRIPEGSTHTFGDLVQGVAFHDIYHAGQVQLLKRLQGVSRKATKAG